MLIDVLFLSVIERDSISTAKDQQGEMAFIDWSDSEGMFDLLIEFIRDEMNASSGDRNRQTFLARLLVKVNEAWEGSPAKAIDNLQAIQDSVENEFKGDPVFSHVTDFIHELKRSR